MSKIQQSFKNNEDIRKKLFLSQSIYISEFFIYFRIYRSLLHNAFRLGRLTFKSYIFPPISLLCDAWNKTGDKYFIRNLNTFEICINNTYVTDIKIRVLILDYFRLYLHFDIHKISISRDINLFIIKIYFALRI